MHFASECHFQQDQYFCGYSVFLPTSSHQGKYDAMYANLALDIHISKPRSISISISLEQFRKIELMFFFTPRALAREYCI